MEIIKINSRTKDIPQSVIALGFFDGVHLAHQAVIRSAIDLAKFLNIKSQVFTFRQHPKTTTGSRIPPLLLSDFSGKVELIKQLGVEFLTFLDFNKEFAKLSPENFVKNILIKKLRARIIVAGFDYRFGSRAKGDINLLNKFGEKYGFKVKVISPVYYNDLPISSTLIRSLISEGKINQANLLLGHFFKVTGKIKEGRGFGRLLGIHTANLSWPRYNIKLAPGVYVVFIKKGSKIYSGVANLGYSPTFKRKSFSLEVHLFDFKGNLYKQKVEVLFVSRLRDERKFKDLDLLSRQIKKDIVKAKKILRREKLKLSY